MLSDRSLLATDAMQLQLMQVIGTPENNVSEIDGLVGCVSMNNFWV
ncbi:hypothetical protein Nos7524_3967 [Nostoc sp. PCC 7524]|nr:hypothetical protein [Nostoc sp. PCC 7524]AFY49740.1 hypothetical protein Nos7524_3967 [Nostoc sp. PCC 7524]